AFAVQRCLGNKPYQEALRYPADYQAMKADSATHPENYLSNQAALFSKYPPLKNAYDVQIAFEGAYEARVDGIPSTDWHGRETGIRGVHGAARYSLADCRDQADGARRDVIPDQYTWFDFDCNYCTGVWNYAVGSTQTLENKYRGGMLHKTWNASTPPPSPLLNTSPSYNYTDNPSRLVAASGDRKITVAWDNASEIAPDPGDVNRHKSVFDFRGWNLYKVSGWTRPVGSPGRAESEWALVASFTMFDYRDPLGQPILNNANNKKLAPAGGDPGDTLMFPKVLYPGHADSSEVKLYRFDLWDRQTGKILRPDKTLHCVKWP